MATEDLLTHCLTDTVALMSDSSKGPLKLSYTSFLTWYKTQRNVVITNSNWTMTYDSGTEPYYKQLYVHEAAGNATSNLQNVAPFELAAQVKAAYDGS